MDRNDRSRAHSDKVFDKIDIEVPSAALGIDWNRNEIVVISGKSSGDIRGSADKNFVAGLQLECRHGELERTSPAAHGHTEFAIAIIRERFFKTLDRLAKRT